MFQVFILMLQHGQLIGWASPNIARFARNDSDIILTSNEISWIASIESLGGLPGAILGPMSIALFGPKQTTLISFVLYSVTWLCTMLANSFFWLLMARFTCGLTMLVACISATIYLGEISRPKIRGSLISISFTGTTGGVLIGTYLETYFPAKVSCPIYLVQCFVGIALLVFVLPESPYFLVKSGKVAKTTKSIMTYLPDEDVEDKLLEIEKFVKDQPRDSVRDIVISVVKSKSLTRSLTVVIVISALMELSGLTSIQRYTEVILNRGKSHILEAHKVIIYNNVFCFFMRLITCNVMDKFGRKLVLSVSSILSTVVLISLGTHFYLLHLGFSLENLQWVPIVCFFVFKSAYTIGFFTGLQVLLSELFPVNVKDVACCLSRLAASFFGFVVLMIFLPVSYSVGEEWIFWMNAVCAFLVTPLVLLLPETKGKKLEEI